MMKVYVCGSSALYYWRRNPGLIRSREDYCKNPLSDCALSSSDLASLRLSAHDFGPAPFHLMVSSPQDRISRSRYAYTVYTGCFPMHAFINLNANICIASPELCLLQAAKKLHWYRVLELSMELCGYYSLVSEAQRGFENREFTLTTVGQIMDFVAATPGIPGRTKLLHVLEYIAEGSRSPMETRMYLLITMPKRYGGYGLARPLVNASMGLDFKDRCKTKRSSLECDLLWPKQKVAIEYDGHDDHESRYDRARDAIKRETLIANGYVVFTVTGTQILDEYVFDSVVRDIARAIGFRLRKFPLNWETRRLSLRIELFRTLKKTACDPDF